MNARVAEMPGTPPRDDAREPAGAAAPRLPAPRAALDDAWHRALPTVPKELCGVGGGLEGAAMRVRIAGGEATLSFVACAGAGPHEMIELQGAAMLAAIGPPRGGRPVEFDWREFSGVSRVLAFAIAHADLLEAFEQALGAPLVAAWCHPRTDARRIDGGLAVGYALVAADGTAWRGDLWLDVQALAALRAALAPVARAAPRRWDALPVPCRVAHVLARLPARRLLALRTHDVVVLGTRTAVAGNLRLEAADGGAAWRVAADAGSLRVLGPDPDPRHDIVHGVRQMNEPTNPQGDADPLDGLRLDLSVELAALQLPLSQLRALGAGDTLPLAIPLDAARATLRVGGQIVGHGELVAAGEQLGVRVLSLDPTAGP